MKPIEREVMLNTILSPKLVMQDTKRLKGRWFKIVQEIFRPTFGIEIEFPLKGSNRKRWICDDARNIISRIDDNLYSNHLPIIQYKKIKINRFANTQGECLTRKLINIGYDCNHPELDMYCSLTALTTMDKVLQISREYTEIPNGAHNLHIHIPKSLREFVNEEGRTCAKDNLSNSPYPELNILMRDIVCKNKDPEYLERVDLSDALSDAQSINNKLVSRFNWSYKTVEYRGMVADLSYTDLMRQLFIINMYHKSVYTNNHKVEKYLDLLPILQTL